jgi:electron transport complex protein RnfG
MASIAMKNMLLSGILLGLFAVVGTGLVSLTYDGTRERIAASEKEALLRSLHALVDPSEYDNDLFTDTIELSNPNYFGTKKPVTIYRARQAGRPVAALFSVIAPDGYGGPIKLLVGFYTDGSVAGVRVIDHRETPGLGDAIEAAKSSWIFTFNGRSRANTPDKNWRVKKDGGVFDEFTGATITPRAVVKAVHLALQFFLANENALFARKKQTPGKTKEHADGK